MNEKEQTHYAITLLKMLWEKFKSQPIYYQAPTLLVILFTMVWILVFYSSFVIWKIFSLTMAKVFFVFVEWYVKKNTPPPNKPLP
jgi:hypothetical protein